MYKTDRQIAKACDRARMTVKDWITSGKMIVPEGGFTDETLAKWIDANIGANENPDYQIAKAKREHHNAELARLKVEQVKGNLLEAHEVEATWSQAMARIAEHFDKEITKAAPKLSKQSPAEILKELRALFRRVREKSMVTQ